MIEKMKPAHNGQMTKYLLDNGYSYVLLGRYTNDHIEKLFGKWRQASGSNYFISVADVVHTQRIQWTKVTNLCLGRSLESGSSSHGCDLCDMLPDEEILMQNLMTENVTSPPGQLVGACAYIAGYLCHQFTNLPTFEQEDLVADEKDSYRFSIGEV